MVRRTKEDALATRSHILDTAELVFEQRGVSGTSLNEIAKAAGLTRGAIYWHFQDKADLFNAMMQRATLPLEEVDNVCGLKSADITLSQMREGFMGVLKRLVADPQMKRVFGIARHKVEYVAEMDAVRARHVAIRNDCLADVERVLKQSSRRGELSLRLPVRSAAIGLHSLLDGLLQNWMLDPAGFDLVKVGRQVLDVYLGSLVAPAVAPAPD